MEVEHAGGLSLEDVEATELSQGLWHWAQDSGAAAASQGAIRATLQRMGRLHPALFQQHGQAAGTPPLEVRTAFLRELAAVDPEAAAAAVAAESGYDSGPGAMEPQAAGPPSGRVEGQWQEVVNKRTRSAANTAKRAAAAATAACQPPPVRKVAMAKKGSAAQAKAAKRAPAASAATAGTSGSSPAAAMATARFPRAAHQGAAVPFWKKGASSSRSVAPTGPAGTGAGRNGRR